MENVIKKLRYSTNKSQREFASTYNIPLSTLKKWEQDESKPAPYVLSLLSSTLSHTSSSTSFKLFKFILVLNFKCYLISL